MGTLQADIGRFEAPYLSVSPRLLQTGQQLQCTVCAKGWTARLAHHLCRERYRCTAHILQIRKRTNQHCIPHTTVLQGRAALTLGRARQVQTMSTSPLFCGQSTALGLLWSEWRLFLLDMLLQLQHWPAPLPIAGPAQQQLSAPLQQSGPAH